MSTTPKLRAVPPGLAAKALRPEKVCAWIHCRAVFVPRTGNQKYCRSLCTSSAQVRPGESPRGYYAHTGPTKPTDQPCGNGCGTWGSPPDWATTPFCCYPCWLGRKHGRVNPCTERPYPAFTASESRKSPAGLASVPAATPKAKPVGRECVFCLGRFRVGPMSSNSRHQRACWPCWFRQVGLAIPPLRAEAEQRIVMLRQQQQSARLLPALAPDYLALDAAGWLTLLSARAGHPDLPATIPYHGARKWQQLLHQIASLQEKLAAVMLGEWNKWQDLIDHEEQALEGDGIRWRAEQVVKNLSRQRREEMAPAPPPYPVGLTAAAAGDDGGDGGRLTDVL